MLRIPAENFREKWGALRLSTNSKKGFTIMELTVVAGILALLTLLVSLILTQGLKSYRYSQNSVKMQDSAARAVRDFESKTRAAEQIIMANPEELIYFAYIANDIRPAPSRIRYSIEEAKLVRGIIPPAGAGPVFSYPLENEITEELASGILNTDSVFSYYSDADYDYSNDLTTKLNLPIDNSRVKMIRILLEVDHNLASAPAAIEETTMVNLRNLKRNL